MLAQLQPVHLQLSSGLILPKQGDELGMSRHRQHLGVQRRRCGKQHVGTDYLT
ncbi:hypothetical protein D3C76_1751420 [compost metagenome]